VSEESKKKNCLACSSPIPAKAKKCVKCGSHQDWRRHLDFGNTSIALLVAFLGLLTAMPTTFSILQSNWRQVRLPAVEIKIIQLGSNKSQIVIRNNGPTSLVASDFACLLAFPRDPHLQSDLFFQIIAAGDAELEVRPLLASEQLFIAHVFYSTDPQVILSGETRVIELSYLFSDLSLPESWPQPFTNQCITPGDGALTPSKLIPVDWNFYSPFGLRDLIQKSNYSDDWNLSKEFLDEVISVYESIP
jgi:hypothetical protein